MTPPDMTRHIHAHLATRLAGALFVALLGLAGCATPTAPAPSLRVVLLPQNDAQGQPLNTAVVVSQQDKVLVLDRPFALAEPNAAGQLAQRVATVDEVQARYGDVLRIQPPSAEAFVLGFLPGKSQLTPESEAQLPMFIERAKARAGGEILVIGHTDRVGKLEANDALSLQRAQAIAKLLEARGFAPELISARGRGEREPLVPTADEVAEPRNRRAEVIIR
jgi:outer membrane protein OmpA-like peptidoglycan-associated protein